MRTEYLTVTEEVATLPPNYLYSVEVTPNVPAGAPPEVRFEAMLEAYAARGDALERCSIRASGVDEWVENIRAVYPSAVVRDFSGE